MPDVRSVLDFDPVALAASIERLERRVAALEASIAAGTPAAAAIDLAAHETTDAAGVTGTDWSWGGTIALTGRTLIALGGAYLLRALTESGTLPPAVGVVFGFLYALVWVWLCVRAAEKALRPSAIFHGLTASLVGFPLVGEATVRFALLDPLSGAILLAAFAWLVLGASRRAGVEPVAWFAALGATVIAFVLAVTTGAFVPFTIAVTSIGIATLWLGYLQEWTILRWPVAAAVNLMVLMITMRAVDPDVPPATTVTVALQLSVLAVYLASFVARALVMRREVIFFEVAQSAAAMGVCFGGALLVLATARISAVPLGIVALALAGASYAFAFAYVERWGQGRNVAFFTSLALAFTLAGAILALPPMLTTVLVAGLALGCMAWADRSGRLLLAWHGLVYATATAGFSGLLGLAYAALVSGVPPAWPLVTLVPAVGLAVVVACAAWPVPVDSDRMETVWPRTFRLARMAVLLFLVSGAAVAVAAPLLAATDAGRVASVRTIILVGAALILVLPERTFSVVRTWAAYALLCWVGVKLVFEDLPQGRPATLFAALAAYGAALIIIPRLARRPAPGAE